MRNVQSMVWVELVAGITNNDNAGSQRTLSQRDTSASRFSFSFSPSTEADGKREKGKKNSKKVRPVRERKVGGHWGILVRLHHPRRSAADG